MKFEILVGSKYCNKSYYYQHDYGLEFGQIIQVQFNKKKCLGIVIGSDSNSHNLKLSPIINVFSHKLSADFIEYIKIVSRYNVISIGSVVEMVLSEKGLEKQYDMIYEYEGRWTSLDELLNKKLGKKQILQLKKWDPDCHVHEVPKIDFEESQLAAIEGIQLALQDNLVSFLYGATGSGKTLVALEAISKLSGKILIITPEVSLSRSWAAQIKSYYGKLAFIYHYKMSKTYKDNVYNWAISDEPGFIVGARSALFLPYKNLQAIIIDEEHSISLKQDRYPKYHARDMSVLRAKIEKFPVLLLSATPSLETFYNIEQKKYQFFKINRLPQMGVPKKEFVKVGSKDIIAKQVVEEIKQRFAQNEQVLFFLNRKGYAPYCVCNSCFKTLKCYACDSFKTLYKNYLVMCHKCFQTAYLPNVCPECKNNTTWDFFGLGVEKLEEFLKNTFPEQKFIKITADNANLEEEIEQINNNEFHGIVATQILVQGHDFKNIGLVIIVDSHMGLSSPDFRSTERIYQLWQQLRGRSGRHQVQGKMIVQYLNEGNKFIELLKNEKPYEFMMNERKIENWPPYTRCGFIIFKSKEKSKAQMFLDSLKLEPTEKVEIHGPLYVGMEKYVHEWRFLVKCENNFPLYKVFEKYKDIKLERFMKMEFEVDPYTFL
jgi:primosomal protein N' (replication factor Y)